MTKCATSPVLQDGGCQKAEAKKLNAANWPPQVAPTSPSGGPDGATHLGVYCGLYAKADAGLVVKWVGNRWVDNGDLLHHLYDLKLFVPLDTSSTVFD